MFNHQTTPLCHPPPPPEGLHLVLRGTDGLHPNVGPQHTNLLRPPSGQEGVTLTVMNGVCVLALPPPLSVSTLAHVGGGGLQRPQPGAVAHHPT